MRFQRATALALVIAASAAATGAARANSSAAPAVTTVATAQTFASPLEAVRSLVEQEAGQVRNVADAGVTRAVDGPQRAYASVWTLDAADGERTAAAIAARETVTGPLFSILMVETADEGTYTPYALQESSGRYSVAAMGVENVVCAKALGAAAGSGLKKLIESAIRRTVYGVIVGIFISAVCAGPIPGTQLKGSTWHNGLFADAYGPYPSGDLVGALEDVVVRPYSCAGGTPGISEPCKGATTSGLAQIWVQFHQTTVWPDGVIAERYYRCDRTFCYQPAYQHHFYATEGTYGMAVYTEESPQGAVYGYIPSGGIRRSYVVA